MTLREWDLVLPALACIGRMKMWLDVLPIGRVCGHTLLLRASDVERVLLRRPHGVAVIAAMVQATLMAIPCSTFMGVFRICAGQGAQTVRIVPRVPWAGNDVRIGIRSRP